MYLSIKGNPVKIGDGPAAVVGDEHRIKPLAVSWSGKVRQVG